MTMSATAPQKKITLTSAASPFPNPVHAVLNGEPVRISHVGDAEGMSPVYLVIDSQGKSKWVKQDDVTITDFGYLPISREVQETVSRAQGSRR